METALFLAKTPSEAYKAVSYLCEDIKAMPEADHALYFSRIMFGGFYIGKGSTDEKTGEKHITGDREILIFPAAYEAQLEKLKVDKTIAICKNCMSIAGDSDLKIQRRAALIKWSLDFQDFDYAIFGLEDENS